MLHSLLFDDTNENFGRIATGLAATFSNIVNITFSAFDHPIYPTNINDKMIPFINEKVRQMLS